MKVTLEDGKGYAWKFSATAASIENKFITFYAGEEVVACYALDVFEMPDGLVLVLE